MEIAVQPYAEGHYVISFGRQSEMRDSLDLAGKIAEAALGQPVRGIIVDLNGVLYISSSGLGNLFSLRAQAERFGAKLVVARPTEGVSRLIDLVNLDRLIPVASTLEEAQKKLQ